MTGEDFKAARELYGETQPQFARRLGYTGSDSTLKRKIIRFESGEQPVVGPLAILIFLLVKLHGKGDTGVARKRTPAKVKQASKVQGGLARAAALRPERRREIAKRAAETRWRKNG